MCEDRPHFGGESWTLFISKVGMSIRGANTLKHAISSKAERTLLPHCLTLSAMLPSTRGLAIQIWPVASSRLAFAAASMKLVDDHLAKPPPGTKVRRAPHGRDMPWLYPNPFIIRRGQDSEGWPLAMMTLKRFRVTNFRSVEDSGFGSTPMM